ncbi:MAG TPA: hypothetical protein VIL57_00455 [Bacteroidia bacterium]
MYTKQLKGAQKVVIFLILLGISFITYSQDTTQKSKSILILGDSHLVGDFGEYLHRYLYKMDKYDITSIAIGGAGSVHFTMTMKNFCCGYKIRVSKKGEVVGEKERFRTLEIQRVLTNEVVYKEYDGKLSKLVAAEKPDIVLIALGSNYVNAHQDLINIIQSNSADSKIIWIGPFLRENFQARIDAILKITNKYKIPLVRSDDIIGNDTLTTTHFYGKTASNWALKVTERLKPHLN